MKKHRFFFLFFTVVTKKANVNIKTSFNEYLLHYLIKNELIQVLKILFSHFGEYNNINIKLNIQTENTLQTIIHLHKNFYFFSFFFHFFKCFLKIEKI